jgi:hypothetical protein
MAFSSAKMFCRKNRFVFAKSAGTVDSGVVFDYFCFGVFDIPSGVRRRFGGVFYWTCDIRFGFFVRYLYKGNEKERAQVYRKEEKARRTITKEGRKTP